jgi:tyrosine-protein phosphatase YwqE
VIAHPERNGQVIQRLQIAYDFVARGAPLQMNAGSL